MLNNSTDKHIEPENQLIIQNYSHRVTKIVHVTFLAPTQKIKGGWKEGYYWGQIYSHISSLCRTIFLINLALFVCLKRMPICFKNII